MNNLLPSAMKSLSLRFALVTLLALFALPAIGPLTAQEAAAINRRMEERLPAIDALKARQVVGENNRGYLEARGELSAEEAALVASENRDRDAVYEAIARRAETTKDAVGRARARQIAERSRPGVWIQGADGSWAVKR
jgi:uncharacterized protein YdbL (DUF1318 family)